MKKVLIAYYSWSGRTQKIARELQTNLIDSDLYQITVAHDVFAQDMFKTSDIAKQQLANHQLPPLTSPSCHFNQYDLILLGSPVWSGKPATPVYSFFKQLAGFQGKVAGFYTDAGNAGDYVSAFTALGKTAKVAIVGTHDNQTNLTTWAKKLVKSC